MGFHDMFLAMLLAKSTQNLNREHAEDLKNFYSPSQVLYASLVQPFYIPIRIVR